MHTGFDSSSHAGGVQQLVSITCHLFTCVTCKVMITLTLSSSGVYYTHHIQQKKLAIKPLNCELSLKIYHAESILSLADEFLSTPD